MSFLSIAFLAALPLVAAPILLHLFDRRRQVVIPWGAMQFLMEAATRRTSARRLKQWLLLLMRVLAIAILVLAMARPMMPGSWLATDDRGETIFVIDNSLSMMRTVGEASLLDTAIERTMEDLETAEPGDFVRVLLASPYPVWATPGSMRADPGSRQLLAEQLGELQPTQGRSDLLSALFTAVQAELQPTQKRRRIVLLTDGQRSDWDLSDSGGWQRFREVLQSAPVPTYLEIIELDHGTGEGSNLAVNHVQSSRTVVGVNHLFTLTAQIENHGHGMSAPCRATWTAGEVELQESQIPSLENGTLHDVICKHSFSETGVYAISCRIEADDTLAPDNRATLVIEVADEVPMLLVESSPDLAEIQQDSFFMQAALGWIDGEPLQEKGVHVPSIISPEQLEQMDLARQRAVVIPNLQQLSEEAVNQLEQFVSDGGGLWIALGPRTDVEAFNQFFFADGNGLAPLALDRIVEEESPPPGPDETRQQTAINPFVKDHPATAELLGNEQLGMSDLAMSRRYRFVDPPEGENVSVLLSLTNGQPLAVERYFGRGRVIVQAIPLRLQWSELARSQAFVVMVHDWLDYLTQPRATRYNLQPGDPISMHLPDSQTRDATLRTPHGDEIELTADAAGDGVVFRSTRTILPGDYRLELGLSGDRIPFHVNRDPQESGLMPLAAGDRQLLEELAGLSRNTAHAALSITNQRDPLWPLLLMILTALIAVELLLSGMIARERFGGQPISETTEHWATDSLTAPATISDRSPKLEAAKQSVT